MARKNMDAFKLIGIHNDFIRVKKEETNEKFEEKKERWNLHPLEPTSKKHC